MEEMREIIKNRLDVINKTVTKVFPYSHSHPSLFPTCPFLLVSNRQHVTLLEITEIEIQSCVALLFEEPHAMNVMHPNNDFVSYPLEGLLTIYKDYSSLKLRLPDDTLNLGPRDSGPDTTRPEAFATSSGLKRQE